jgi:hypothetical protein
MKVRVYFNLHKKLLSVQTKVNGRWKVVKHVDKIALSDVRFKVSETGRQRVLREKRKNVHAFIEGEESSFFDRVDLPLDSKVMYNPYKYEKFTTGEKYVDKAEYAVIMGRTILAINPQ